MKKSRMIWAAAVLGLMTAGCGQTEFQEETSIVIENLETEAQTTQTVPAAEAETAQETEEGAGGTEAQEQEKGLGEELTAETVQAENQGAEGYEDNFAVDSEAAGEFAQKVKDAVAAKDLEALADLTAFPVYVGLPEAGAVETREEFLALGAEKVFTEALSAAVESADVSDLQPSMAGFSISGGGSANINFGVRDGVLAISGINY